jgi:hypothetical protein
MFKLWLRGEWASVGLGLFESRVWWSCEQRGVVSGFQQEWQEIKIEEKRIIEQNFNKKSQEHFQWKKYCFCQKLRSKWCKSKSVRVPNPDRNPSNGGFSYICLIHIIVYCIWFEIQYTLCFCELENYSQKKSQPHAGSCISFKSSNYSDPFLIFLSLLYVAQPWSLIPPQPQPAIVCPTLPLFPTSHI